MSEVATGEPYDEQTRLVPHELSQRSTQVPPDRAQNLAHVSYSLLMYEVAHAAFVRTAAVRIRKDLSM